MLQACKPDAHTGQSSRKLNSRISCHLGKYDLPGKVSTASIKELQARASSWSSLKLSKQTCKGGLVGVTKLDFPKSFLQSSSPKKT